MTEDTNQQLPPGIRYTGPETDAHIAAWHRLYERITKGGRWVSRGHYLNLLNDLAFGSEPSDLLIAGIPDAEKGYRVAKTEVEAIAAVSSDIAGRDENFRFMHDAIANGLVARWNAYKGTACRPGVKGMPAGTEFLTNDRCGSFLYGAVRMAHDFTMRVRTDQLLNWARARFQIDEGWVAQLAEGEFQRTLMAHNPELGAFNALLSRSLQQFLKGRVVKEAKRLAQFGPGPEAVRDGTDWSATFEDHRTTTDETAAQEDKRRLQEAIARLKPEHREILEQRFGLVGGTPRTQPEIADSEGVTRQAIGVREKKAMEALRAIMDRPEGVPPGSRTR